MNPDQSEQEIINKDKKTYPHCNYSIDFSRVCSSQNGSDMVCETARNLQRLCPGKRPATIYTKREKVSGDDVDSNLTPSIPNLFRGLFGGNEEVDNGSRFGSHNQEGFGIFSPADAFRMMEDALNQFAKDLPNGTIGDKHGPSSKVPPHKVGRPDTSQPDSRPKPFGGITGPVEEI